MNQVGTNMGAANSGFSNLSAASQISSAVKQEPAFVALANYADHLVQRAADLDTHASRIVGRLVGHDAPSVAEGNASAGQQAPRPVDSHLDALRTAMSAIERRMASANAHLNRLADNVGVDRS